MTKETINKLSLWLRNPVEGVKKLFINNTSIPARLYVATCAVSVSHQSFVPYQSPSRVCRKASLNNTSHHHTSHSNTSHYTSGCIDAPSSRIFVIAAPSSRCLSYSSPLAAVNCLDHIRPTHPGVYLGPKDHSIPAWREYQASRTTNHISGNW